MDSKGYSAASNRRAKLLFVLALLVTLVSLLTPGAQVLAFKVWVASWLPFASELNAANISHNSDKLVHGFLFACMGFWAVRRWTLRRQLAWALLLRRAKRSAAVQQPNGELPGQPAPSANGARVG